MKNTTLLLSLTAAAAISVCGCNRDTDATGAQNSISIQSKEPDENPTAELGLPADYFPTAIGTRWVYEITVPDFDGHPPLKHCVTIWPQTDDKALAYEQRGRMLAPYKPTKDGHLRLIMTVAGLSTKQGPLKYPEGYELKVERDDIGIYCEHYREDFSSGPKIFWAVGHSGGYRVNLVIMHEPDEPGAPTINNPWGGYGASPGYSMRVFFFGERPMTSLGLNNQNDSLLFVGQERFNDVMSLHYRRTVDADKDDQGNGNADSSPISSGFTEDMWFTKGIGLARLVQKVDDQTTMTWQLINIDAAGNIRSLSDDDADNPRLRL